MRDCWRAEQEGDNNGLLKKIKNNKKKKKEKKRKNAYVLKSSSEWTEFRPDPSPRLLLMNGKVRK